VQLLQLAELLESDKIVSDCPLNNDNDLANNNIDIDLDNDGINTEPTEILALTYQTQIQVTISTGDYSIRLLEQLTL
jgi:hypothetical protein